ncbi:MAG: hypothetical protein V3U80_10575 [Flavobacteriaceae bacterium]
MKQFFILVLFLGLFSCDSDEVDTTYLPNVSVNEEVNLNLPQFQDLLIGGGFAYANGGIEGLIIYNTGIGYVAFDRACPHIPLQQCSTMSVDGIYMVCPCDDKRFQINNGAPEDGTIHQSARFYNVTQNGNILVIRS